MIISSELFLDPEEPAPGDGISDKRHWESVSGRIALICRVIVVEISVTIENVLGLEDAVGLPFFRRPS